MEGQCVTRKIDEMGRVTLPVDYRQSLGLKEGNMVALRYEDGRISIEKMTAYCCLCGGADSLEQLGGKSICRACIERIKQSF